MTLLDISDYTLDLPDGTRLLDGVSLSVAAGCSCALAGAGARRNAGDAAARARANGRRMNLPSSR